MEKHPRLYREVPWGQGGPGRFILLCGGCPFRKDWNCTHPNLKANGGNGLEVRMSNLPKVHVCFSNGTGGQVFPNPATYCAGHPNPPYGK